MGKRVTVEVARGERVLCVCPDRVAIHIGDRCLFEQAGLTESGLIIFEDSSIDINDASLPVIVRCETLQDQARVRENGLLAEMAEESCRRHVLALKLDMRLVRVRYSYDRKLLLVVFAADDRVDFRELVKRLTGEFRCRVELRQIGIRDEAGLIGGLGSCGQVQCCTRWLQRFESVNVRMARTQGLSLNPQAISGMCGRLKCCLRYEEDQYQEAIRGMPRDGGYVEGPDGPGRVIELQVLAQRVRVRLEDGRVMTYDSSDVRMLQGRPRCARHTDQMQEVEE